MKKLILIITLLFAHLIAISQDFQDGYLTLKSGMTLYSKIKITPNDQETVLITDGITENKFSKELLIDYGYIKKGKKVSIYAATAFNEYTYKGYYIKQHTLDTVLFYVIKVDKEFASGYLANGKKVRMIPSIVQEVHYSDEEGKEQIYDSIFFQDLILSRKGVKEEFLIRKNDGRIRLYSSTIGKREVSEMTWGEYFTSPSMSGEIVVINPFSKKRKIYNGRQKSEVIEIPIYVIKKNNKITIIPMIEQTVYKDKLKKVIKDFPAISNRIGEKGFQNEDIPEIIKKYNSFFYQQ